MPSRTVRSLLLLALCCCWVSPSYAQMFQMNNTMPKYPLLMSKPVQKELKLTEEQIKKIDAKIKELTPEGSFMKFDNKDAKDGEEGAPKIAFSFKLQGAGNAPPIVGGNFDPSKMSIPGLPDIKKIDEEVDKLLEQPQRDRLKQLVLQRQGISAIVQDSVAKDLGLEAEQKELIKQIMDDQKKKTQEVVQQMLANGGFDQEKMRTEIKKLREQTDSDLALILTPDQQARWEELKGTKFEFKK